MSEEYKVIRTETAAQRAGAHYVRIQGMAVKHHIPLELEFDEHDNQEAKYIVLIDDVLPVATCRLYPYDDETMQLSRLVVLPEYRGKGLGRKVVTEAENWSRDLGYSKVMLESRDNKVDFYRKQGYVGDEKNTFFKDPFWCVMMEKSL
ncbi:MAG: GNAT family N-acetyltransferase [Firmicutes bacterium]|nr:GNAT family N-acetyltransferase [Bacillota bacterium]